MKGDGGPAFPTPYETRDGDTFSTCYEGGMTLRDYFAAKALQGLLALPNEEGARVYKTMESIHRVIAITAYAYADAMLREREK